jgi:hypothetical protein
MTVGLPGTGIGGLYYVLLALWMPFQELGRTLVGRGSRARWRLVAGQASISLAMLTALSGEAWLLERVLFWIILHTRTGSYSHVVSLMASRWMVPVAATWITFGILGSVILMIHALRICVPRTPRHRGRGALSPRPEPSIQRAELVPGTRVSGTV